MPCVGSARFSEAQISKPPDSLPGAREDLLPSATAIRHRAEVERLTDSQLDFPGARYSGRGWKRTERTAQVTGDDRNGRAGREHAQPRLERTERAIAAA